jgi:protocatechuate 3,4-dioxygenase beta subunit
MTDRHRPQESPMHDDHHDDDPDHRGLAFDLRRMAEAMSRRQWLRMALGAAVGATVLPLLGCNDTALASGNGGTTDGGGTGGDGGTCTTIPEETAGPYPGDGSNGPNILSQSGIVRTDIRSSIGSMNGTAVGVPLTVTLTLVDNAACAPLVGYAIYIWHCDRGGDYSLYTAPTQNYLRGVQITDDQGQVTFQTIFPGCYSGRWPHIHFEIYPGAAQATSAGSKLATSQLALPQATCEEVYAESGYEQSVINLAGVSLATDNVFRDGAGTQTPAVTGNVSDGYQARLVVAISG